jgi:transcriptional regulator with XRE-family HTH domain
MTSVHTNLKIFAPQWSQFYSTNATHMYTHPQRLSARQTRKLRSEAGLWLRELREKRGLSQRALARKVGSEYYTFISQLELGRGRVPPDRYLLWADALGIAPRDFVRGLMSYYDPVTYDIMFGGEGPRVKTPAGAASRSPAQSSTIVKMRKSRSPGLENKKKRSTTHQMSGRDRESGDS